MAISFHDFAPCGFNLQRLNQFSGGFICETIISVPREAICAPAHRRRPNNRAGVAPDSTALCEKVPEPMLEKFGQFAITDGYECREGIEQGMGPPSGGTADKPYRGLKRRQF
jgi:hypothetical protein